MSHLLLSYLLFARKTRRKNRPGFLSQKPGGLCSLYWCFLKPSRKTLRGVLIAAWVGDKIAEFSFPEISFHFPLRPWFFFASPAYAGKSVRHAALQTLRRDHPRVCGETSPLIFAASAGAGITPAYAGKREFNVVQLKLLEDHPRVCGEKKVVAGSGGGRVGSPPRMRGKVLAALMPANRTGITPAYAGKSLKKRSR